VPPPPARGSEAEAQGLRNSRAELSRLRFHNHTWFHITRYAGSFVAHNHPMASWSAVYCVRAGEVVKKHPQSGLLRFFDPRQGANAYLDPANDKLHAPFALRSLEIRLAAGDLVVFPSYLFHEVTPFYGADTRITEVSTGPHVTGVNPVPATPMQPSLPSRVSPMSTPAAIGSSPSVMPLPGLAMAAGGRGD